MAYHSKFTGKEVDDILDSVSGKQDKLSETNQVQKGQIADRAVEGKNVAINAITTSKIKDGNVTTEKIALLAITDALIASNAVSLRKLSSQVQNSLSKKFVLSSTDIADWSGTDTQFKNTFVYSLSDIIDSARTTATLVSFNYKKKDYLALANCVYDSTAKSVSFLIHNSDGLTELISMNLDGSNVTVTSKTLGGGSEMNEFYLLPSPDASDFEIGAEITNWTKEMLEAAASAKAVMCNMVEFMLDLCYGPADVSTGTDGSITVNVSALSSPPSTDTGMELQAIHFVAKYDPTTDKITYTNVSNANTTISDKSEDPYIVVESGSKDFGFYNLATNPYTFPSATSFKMQFGFAFSDLMIAAEKPLLLKTKDTDGNKVVMHAVSCMDNGDTMRIDFLNGDILYYCRSTDGGVTIKTGLYTLQTTTN